MQIVPDKSYLLVSNEREQTKLSDKVYTYRECLSAPEQFIRKPDLFPLFGAHCIIGVIKVSNRVKLGKRTGLEEVTVTITAVLNISSFVLRT